MLYYPCILIPLPSFTALHEAVRNGHLGTTEILLQHGANPLARTMQAQAPLALIPKVRSAHPKGTYYESQKREYYTWVIHT